MTKNSLKLFALVLGLGSMVFASSCKKDDKSCCSGTDDEGVKKTICEGDTYDGEVLEGDAWTAFKLMATTYGEATCD